MTRRTRNQVIGGDPGADFTHQPASPDSENILGFPVTTNSTEECTAFLSDWATTHQTDTRFCACANPHSLETAKGDKAFHDALQTCDVLTPDGIGVVLASRLLGGHIRRRITGNDIFMALNHSLNERGVRYFFLGSTPMVLDRIRSRLAEDFPGIEVAGTYSPPFVDQFSSRNNSEILDAVNHAKADVLWVGMTAPKQEKWISANREQLGVNLACAVGAVFDFYAGTARRSSTLFQRAGLEWLPRLIREPRRMWRRNINGVVFLLRAACARVTAER